MTVDQLIQILCKLPPDREITVQGCSCPYTHDIAEVREYGLKENENMSDQKGELTIFLDA